MGTLVLFLCLGLGLWAQNNPSLQVHEAEVAGAKGEEAYKANCSACHQLNGQGVAGGISSPGPIRFSA